MHSNDQIVLSGGTNVFGHGVDITPGSSGVAGGALTLQDLGSTALSIGDMFTIVLQMGTAQTVGTFDGLPEGATVSAGNNTYEIHYHGGTSMEDIFLEVVSPVPEPGTWAGALLAAGFAGYQFSVTRR